MAETILITGGSGFVGQAVVRALRSDSRAQAARLVWLSDDPSAGETVLRARRDPCGVYHLHRDDLAERGIDRINRVIHLGAATPKSSAEADDPNAAMANVVNLAHLTAFLPEAPSRFVFASTLDVYGIAATGIAENRPCNPESLYGASKLFGERWLAALYHDRDRLQILRLGHIYGPGEDAYRKFIPHSIRRLLAGQPPQFITNGRERRAFLHVDDCARMIAAATFAPDTTGPINLAASRALPLADVAELLCDIHRRESGEVLVPTFAEQSQRGSDLTLDNGRMLAAFGPERIDLEQGLTDEYRAMAAA